MTMYIRRSSIAPAVAASRFAKFAWLLVLISLYVGCRQRPQLRVIVPRAAPVLEIAAREVAARLTQAGYQVEVATGADASASQTHAMILSVDESLQRLGPEGFQIIPMQAGGFQLLRVTGHDPRGAFWGALEAADQIVSGDGLEAVQETQANRSLAIRAIRAPLPVPGTSVSLEGQMEAHDRWRQYFDLLARSRLNSIFFEVNEPVSNFVSFQDAEAASSALPAHLQENLPWLRDLFHMAQDRGLDSFLLLTRSSLEAPVLGAGLSPPEQKKDLFAQALPAAFQTYPELAGAAIAADVAGLPGAAENPGSWIRDNLLRQPLSVDRRRVVFLSVDGFGWPAGDTFSSPESGTTVALLAPFAEISEAPENLALPVLWELRDAPSAPLAWEDPEEVRARILQIGTKNSLGFLQDFGDSPPQQKEANGDSSQMRPPDSEKNWFRLLLRGRLGYSPQVPDNYWEQQFASKRMRSPAVR